MIATRQLVEIGVEMGVEMGVEVGVEKGIKNELLEATTHVVAFL